MDVTPPRRILVSGAAGFIGSHLCEALVRAGHEVVGLDNLLTGSLENVKALAEHPRFRFLRHDVTEPLPDGLKALDHILHLASPASPADYANLPIETLMVNSAGTRHLLELARRTGARFLLASTSEVYGDPLVSPQSEEYCGNANPVGPRSCYNEGKRFAEALTMAYQRRHGLTTTIARVFNCYGPRMRQNDGRVIPQFITQCLRGEPITIYGSGRQDRSFCYIDDMLRGLVAAALSGRTRDVVLNLGSPTPITILELAEQVRALTGARSPIRHEPLPEDDPQTRCPDVRRARELLGFEPVVGLEAGLRATIEDFERRLGSGPAAARARAGQGEVGG